MENLAPGLLLALFFIGIIFLVIVFRFIPVGLWIQAITSGVRVSFLTLFGMRFRKVNPSFIVLPLINAHKAGLNQVTLNELESHYLSGGNVSRVVNALISADKAGIPLPFKQATAIDLAGRDVFEAVQVSVNPKVITTPKVAAMAQGRHSAPGAGAGDGARQHQPAGGRRRRGDHPGAGRRGHRQHHRLGGESTRRCWRIPT